MRPQLPVVGSDLEAACARPAGVVQRWGDQLKVVGTALGEPRSASRGHPSFGERDPANPGKRVVKGNSRVEDKLL